VGTRKAVAAGSVILEIGVFAEKLVCTSGYIELASDHFPMHGIGGFIYLLKLTSHFGWGRIQKVKYQPWA
jgi:hypothetical protein